MHHRFPFRDVIVVVVSLTGLLPRIAVLLSLAGHSVCWDVDSCSLASGLNAIHGPIDALSQFHHSWAGPNRFYRPLLSIEEWMVWKSVPDSHRIQVFFALQLLLHITGAVLLMHTLKVLRVAESTAVAAACLFGGGGSVLAFLGLPSQSYGLLKPMIDLPEPLMLNIICLSTLAFVRYWHTTTIFNLAVCLSILAIGLLNKESEAAILIVWFAYTFTPEAKPWPKNTEARFYRAAVFASVLALYIWVRSEVLQGIGPVYNHGDALHRAEWAVGGSLVNAFIYRDTLALSVASALLSITIAASGRFAPTWVRKSAVALWALAIALFVVTAISQDCSTFEDMAILGYRLFLSGFNLWSDAVSIALFTGICVGAIALWQEWPIQLAAIWTVSFALLWLPMATNLQAEYLIAPGWCLLIATVSQRVWLRMASPHNGFELGTTTT